MSSNRSLFPILVLISLLSIGALFELRESHAGELLATWNDNSSDEDGFRIERRTGTNQTYTQIAIVAANVTSYKDFGLVDGEIYCYRVLAFNTSGSSPYSNESCATARPVASRGLLAAVLPSSRSLQVGMAADIFASVINMSSITVTSCGITLLTNIPVIGLFQATHPSTNQLIGSPNMPVDIPTGGVQSFFVRLTPTDAFAPTDVQMRFGCSNTDPAPIITGLNTLLLSASTAPTPDIVALVATPTNDGLVTIPGINGIGGLSVATLNMGAGGIVTVAADTGGVSLPLIVSLCQTNPATGQCISAIGPSVATTINANEAPTFGIFVMATGDIPFDPAVNRIFVRFSDRAGIARGSTSVAVRTH